MPRHSHLSDDPHHSHHPQTLSLLTSPRLEALRSRLAHLTDEIERIRSSLSGGPAELDGVVIPFRDPYGDSLRVASAPIRLGPDRFLLTFPA